VTSAPFILVQSFCHASTVRNVSPAGNSRSGNNSF
jgi:hypothetical protein